MENKAALALEVIQRRIFSIRGRKVMLSADLAQMYGVAPKVLMQAVRRNIERFPEDFIHQLTLEEVKSLRSQIVTLKRGQHPKYPPYAFTEQGVAMLSSVLHSRRAIQVNIVIMRAFIKIRQMLSRRKELAQKLAQLEQRIEGHDKAIRNLFGAMRQLLEPPKKPRRRIGFHDGSG